MDNTATKPTPREALGILDAIADPRNQGKLTRVDYANAEAALLVLAALVAANEKAT